MSIKLLKESSASVPVPPDSHTMLFVDTTGQPALKDSEGNVSSTGVGILVINWKNGTPGNPYVNGDTATAALGELVMVFVEDPQVVSVQFPSANVVGALITVNNLKDKNSPGPGVVNFIPAAGESIGAGAVDETVTSTEPILVGSVTFLSDGNGIWHVVGWGGPGLASPAPPP